MSSLERLDDVDEFDLQHEIKGYENTNPVLAWGCIRNKSCTMQLKLQMTI
ncbi:hypothetical protein KAR91_34955 [Candidatus Pacearchaeota archaeon]|nr:hypothetical protein [Candidatus Pacearchaeota archaeon]